MADFVPSEKGTTIRQPSTANLMIDSADRFAPTQPTSNILVAKDSSILNGFFTRIGTTEVVLEWRDANFSAALNNLTFQLDILGATGTPYTLTLPEGFYTAASLIQAITALCSSLSGTTGTTFAAAGGNGIATITPAVNTVQFRLLGFAPTVLGIADIAYTAAGDPLIVNGTNVDLRPYRYLDFISTQLTYNQDLKDATSSRNVDRDVLCRWYFAFDQPPSLDAYGMPILMGYTPFVLRRSFSPPKQIRWDARQPLGQLSFQVYPNSSPLLAKMDNSQWLMTLQVSEV